MTGNVARLAAVVLLSAALGFLVAMASSPKIFTAVEYLPAKEPVIECLPVECPAPVETTREVNVTVNQSVEKLVVPNFMSAAADIYSNKSYYLSYYPVSYRNRMNDDYLTTVTARLGYDGKRRDGWIGNELSNCVTWTEVWVPVDAATGKMVTPEEYKNYHQGTCKTT